VISTWRPLPCFNSNLERGQLTAVCH